MGEEGSPRPRRDIEIPQDDTEDVPFSPQVDTGYGTQEVKIGEQTIEIHRTHNLPQVFAAYIRPPAEHYTTQEKLSLIDQVYGARLKNDGYEGLFSRLKQEYPRLYAKVVSLVMVDFAEADAKNKAATQYGKDSFQYAQQVKIWQKSSDDVALREYFFSKAFDAFAVIAPEIDLDAPLSALCED